MITDSIIIKRDGNQFFAHWNDFQDLQESPAGFGDNIEEAVNDLGKQTHDRMVKFNTEPA